MSMRSVRVVTILLLLSGVAYSAQQAGGQSGALGSALADITKMPDLFTATWGLMPPFVEDDEKRNVPFTAAAQKYVDSYKYLRDIPYAEDGCRTPGLPIAMRVGGALKFSYSPGLISIHMGAVGDTRFIRMNQQHGQTSPKYYGNSVGHWEGDTLVVETVNFVPEVTFQYGVGKGLPPAETFGISLGGGPGGAARLTRVSPLTKAIFGPHGEGMRMVERMRLVNPETLEVSLTIYDDTVWTKPYEMTTRNYNRRSGEPSEWVCTVSITNFDPETNTYNDKDPEEMIKFLDKLGR